MSNEQKLREALQAMMNRFSGTVRLGTDAENLARAALALPTAAPVDEREAFEALFRERYGWDTKDFKRDSRGDYMDGNTVTAWMSWQARAALREKESNK